MVLSNICYLISINLILFDVVNLAWAVFCTFWRILCLCCYHIILKEVPVEPIYSLSLTFALYTPFSRHSPINGQFVLFLQLHVLFVLILTSKIFLLCELIIFLILGKQLWEILIVFLLKILWNLLFFGKYKWTSSKNLLPIFVLIEYQNEGFNGECLQKGVYKAKVRDKEHIGSTGTSFKTIWQQHKYSILKKVQKTAQAKFTTLNDIKFIEIKWNIV